MYGIGAVKYKGAPVGYIAKNSFDMGGVKPEAAEIEAEQVPGARARHTAVQRQDLAQVRHDTAQL